VTHRDELDADEQLVLSDMLNHVLDKGVVITGDVVISIADVDLVQVKLSLLISSVETAARQLERRHARGVEGIGGDLPVLPGGGG
jgi:hypothetical protein